MSRLARHRPTRPWLGSVPCSPGARPRLDARERDRHSAVWLLAPAVAAFPLDWPWGCCGRSRSAACSPRRARPLGRARLRRRGAWRIYEDEPAPGIVELGLERLRAERSQTRRRDVVEERLLGRRFGGRDRLEIGRYHSILAQTVEHLDRGTFGAYVDIDPIIAASGVRLVRRTIGPERLDVTLFGERHFAADQISDSADYAEELRATARAENDAFWQAARPGRAGAGGARRRARARSRRRRAQPDPAVPGGLGLAAGARRRIGAGARAGTAAAAATAASAESAATPEQPTEPAAHARGGRVDLRRGDRAARALGALHDDRVAGMDGACARRGGAADLRVARRLDLDGVAVVVLDVERAAVLVGDLADGRRALAARSAAAGAGEPASAAEAAARARAASASGAARRRERGRALFPDPLPFLSACFCTCTPPMKPSAATSTAASAAETGVTNRRRPRVGSALSVGSSSSMGSQSSLGIVEVEDRRLVWQLYRVSVIEVVARRWRSTAAGAAG